MERKTSRRKPSAFSMIELLVVIGIISILASLLLPALKAAADTAKSISCTNNLKQMSLACQAYLSDYDSIYPLSTLAATQKPGWAPYLPLNWHQRLDAYMGKRLKPSNVDSTTGYSATTFIPIWNCPTDFAATQKPWNYAGNTSYFGNAYLFRAWSLNDASTGAVAVGVNSNGKPHTSASQIQNPSMTLMVGHWTHASYIGPIQASVLTSCKDWNNSWRHMVLNLRAPNNYPEKVGWFHKHHGGRANYLGADGHAALLNKNDIGDSVNPSYGFSDGSMYFVPPPINDINW